MANRTEIRDRPGLRRAKIGGRPGVRQRRGPGPADIILIDRPGIRLGDVQIGRSAVHEVGDAAGTLQAGNLSTRRADGGAIEIQLDHAPRRGAGARHPGVAVAIGRDAARVGDGIAGNKRAG